MEWVMQLPLDQAPEAYKNFDQRGAGWTKVVLKPGNTADTVVETVSS